MPMPRSLGSSHVTFLSLMKIWPSVTSRRPAMQFKSVVLPQPDEPSRTRNSPFWMSRLSVSSTVTAPKLNDRSLTDTLTFFMYSPFHCAAGDTADKKPSGNEIDDQGNGPRQDGRRHVDVVFLHALDRVDDVVELDGHRIIFRSGEH